MSAAPARKKKATPKGGSKVGRGTRWTEEQVALLLDAVKASATAKEGFAIAAERLGKNTGTVQQKYYSVIRAAGGGRPRKRGRRPGRPVGSTTTAARTARATASSGASSSILTQAALKQLSVDELVGLASRVKDEVDRRRRELDAASALFG